MLPKIKIKEIEVHNYYFTTQGIYERKFVSNYHILQTIGLHQP
jgi:GTP1/Obg family GTP-binding protein